MQLREVVIFFNLRTLEKQTMEGTRQDANSHGSPLFQATNIKKKKQPVKGTIYLLPVGRILPAT